MANLEAIDSIIKNIPWISSDKSFDAYAKKLESTVIGDYPSDFRILFNHTPVYAVSITNKILLHEKYLEFQELLLSKGFIPYDNTINSFKFVDTFNKIVIFGDIVSNHEYEKLLNTSTNDVEEDCDITSQENTIFFNFYPHERNKLLLIHLINELKKLLIDVPEDTNNFYMISQNSRGILSNYKTSCNPFPIKDDRYDLFYGSNFPHKKIMKFITGETTNLLLLHGDPGTGKSNYIKNMISHSKKKVIYVPPSMLSVLSTPQFIQYMMDNKNSILLIEDAEEVLSIDRNTATNNLLGLTDGFLKDALKLKIICTFNCDVGKIDPALLRKGRLYFEYKFTKLASEEATNLAKFMNLDVQEFNQPMSLAEIFNKEEVHVEETLTNTRRIGFF